MREVESTYRAGEVEARIQEAWRTGETYRKVRDHRAGGKPFFFVDGPPYTTGNIHLGTAWNKILKDAILRYHRLKGRHIIERAGYDMHGLPIEVKVEHQLGFSTKKEIEGFGIGAFVEECRSFALRNEKIMSGQFRALGVWLDFDDPYLTVTPGYIEAAWWTLARAEERGMLEKGHRVVNWCPRCETAIADSEVEYWDRKDPSIFVKFPVKGRKGEFLVIWTTTPWTLPANVAAAVMRTAIYAKVRAEKDGRSEILWMADDLVDQVLRKGRYQEFEVLEKVPGSDLVGLEYESPLAGRVPFQREYSHKVLEADFVTLENTGIVHIAPGHGWDDYLLGLKEGLPIFCPVDGTGRFTAEGGAYDGTFVRDADALVLEDLGDSLMAKGEVVHRYGHCWRCKTPIIFRATSQWFLKASEIREAMLAECAAVTWYPEWAGSARFYDWLKEARDWCISRQRYWGIPIPIWECRSCGTHRVVGTLAELEDLSGMKVPDPHRPYVDEIAIPCACGGTMKRVEDIFDVWFDSAVASWATLGFPAEKEGFERYWPADFITEGQDQTRGWFYSQLGASTIAFSRSPYRSVLMHGFALDAEGRKMSKSLGNVVSPEEVIGKAGVDVLRLYILSANAPWDDLKFNWEGVKTVNRAVNILWNVYRFPLPYMILDGYAPPTDGKGQFDPSRISDDLTAMCPEDRWILSRISTLTAEVDAAMQVCELHRATRAILEFILEDLSRWYVQLVRPRMWLEGDSPGKRQAYDTIYFTMRRLVQILSPFTPHLAEEIYRNLRLPEDAESVHMLDWPGADPALTDERLEKAMAVIRSFDDAVANARQAAKRKLRWPVAEVVVETSSRDVARALRDLGDIARARANTKLLTVVEKSWDRMGIRAEPVMRAIGPAFGKSAPRVKALIEAADGKSIQDHLAHEDTVILTGAGKSYKIGPTHVTFRRVIPEGFTSAPMDGATVYVDSRLTPELEGEGYAREVIRRLQEMRRQLDLAVGDFIIADVVIGDPRIASLVRSGWTEKIREEVRARPLFIREPGEEKPAFGGGTESSWDIEGIEVMTAVSRAP
ncbi:MAG TPA: isoleucine--tRNA ligase [Methanomicrobiales archaeon]|nr:isoleucine--tRNA ligase [Methanomicrobiales archaeon]